MYYHADRTDVFLGDYRLDVVNNKKDLLELVGVSPSAQEVEILLLNKHLLPDSDQPLACLGTIYKDHIGRHVVLCLSKNSDLEYLSLEEVLLEGVQVLTY